jgi:hypothetical protein
MLLEIVQQIMEIQRLNQPWIRSHVQIANTLCLERVLKDFNILEDGDGGEMRNSSQNRRRRAHWMRATARPIH